MTRILLLQALLFLSFISSAQEITKGYFRSPLDIPLYLSGNFGELRSNHFHAGLDIKTQGVEGQKVYAIADGYVSRIKVSPYGYGTALYVTHPNGFTSVYGHLKKYNETIEKVVKAYQYQKEQFSVQIFPPPYQLQVKKGDVIAYSGNSGGSGGPHLHFEIRNTKTEHPYNPLFFGFDIKDNVNPDIYAVTIYPLNDSSFINGSNRKKRIKAKGANGIYRFISNSPINLYGEFGFGIETVDRMSGTENTYGLHNIKLSYDSKPIYEHQIDEFAFHEGRYINSYLDYETYIKKRKRVQKSFIQKGNRLRIYKQLENKGTVSIRDGKEHVLKYTVSDLNGNNSSIQFKVSGNSTKIPSQAQLKQGAPKVKFFPYNQRNTFVEDSLLLDLPKGVLYDDLYFEYQKTGALSNTVSPVYWLHNHYTPLHSYITISIKGSHLSASQRNKALIVSTVDRKHLYAEGGKWKGDNISAKTRSFGGYAIALDSIAPKITPINIYANANMSKKWSISLKITDNLSGIGSYRGTIDGKWVLMEYDAKNDKLSYFFDDERLKSGQHVFQLVVKDKVGNKKIYKANFTR